MPDGKRQKVNVGKLLGSLEMRRIHHGFIKQADIVGPEFVEWGPGRSPQPGDHLVRRQVIWVSWLRKNSYAAVL